MAVPFTLQILDTLISAPWLKTVGDLNGDGLDDLLVGDHASDGLYWYRAPTWTRATISPSERFITDGEVADIDRDGRDDVVGDPRRWIGLYDNGASWNRVPIGTQVLHDVEIADLDRRVNRQGNLTPNLEWAPRAGQSSGCSFDRRPGVLLLELHRAEIAERGV